MDLGKNLIRICNEKGITITHLARLAKIKQPTIHGWTTGRTVRNLEDLKKVSTALNVSLHELLFGTPDPIVDVSSIFQEIFSEGLQITIHKITTKEKQ